MNKNLFVSIEDNIFRWNVDGIKTALNLIAKNEESDCRLYLYITDKSIPQIVVSIELNDWRRFNKGEISALELSDVMEISYNLTDGWSNLKKQFPLNSPINKIDFVLYPQFAIQNRLLKQIYEVTLNFAPAFEVSLWEGMIFTGQVLFPIRNDFEVLEIEENVDYYSRNFLFYSNEGDFIRPGFVTISQSFRLPRQWFGNVSIGKFNSHRYGVDLTVNHPLKKKQWSIGGNVGLTGSSHFYHGLWVTGSLNNFTWNINTGYFYPELNTQLNVSLGSYINNDKGFRFDCTRHFGATTIGFFAMYTSDWPNGGFNVTIPISKRKQNRKHLFRVRIPGYINAEYNARQKVFYGREYETKPNENKTEYNINPLYIKNQLSN